MYRRALAQAPPRGATAAASAAAAPPPPPPGKVLVEIFVMSMCSDAVHCERVLGGVLEKLHPVAHLQPEYIMKKDGGYFECLHGFQECIGNSLQLCVRKHVPAEKNFDWLVNFLLRLYDGSCPYYPYRRVGVECALDKAGVSGAARAAIGACLNSSTEAKPLMKSTAAAVAARGVTKSCTVMIDGRPRCVRDGGLWYNCPDGYAPEDFARSICEAHLAKTGAAAPACAGVLAPAAGAGAGGRGGGAAPRGI
ncbi:MAG: hypothetical protein J3K34DRAFT_516420 [Monoraphidium minutum]|nr:MAG: hypothetical protein J3K34DRAFT_516420 [Monoraphidium minutum]